MANLQGEAWHNEQRRRSQDMIRVYNPTDEEYILIWDGVKFRIPAKDKDIGYGKGMRVMQRYLAEKYTKEMVDKLIIKKSDDKLQEVKAAMQARGAADVEFNANQQTMHQFRVDDPNLREPLEDQIFLGIEEEFGVDDIIEDRVVEKKTYTNPFERLKDKKYVSPVKKEEQKPTQKVKHDLSEVAA